MVFSIMSQHSCSCSSVITNGGAKRMMSPCVGLASRPFSFRAHAHVPGGAAVGGWLNNNGIQQAFAAYDGHQFRAVGLNAAHPLPENFAHDAGIFGQVFVFNYLQGRHGNGAGQRVAAEGRAVLARLNGEHDLVVAKHRRHRQHARRIGPCPESEYRLLRLRSRWPAA